MPKNIIISPKPWLQDNFEEKWFEEDLVKNMIMDVDKTECYGAYNLKSPVLGPINFMSLSNGVCNLIIAAHIDLTRTINATKCGDNCAEWLLRISEQKDLAIYLNHVMPFKRDFKAKVLNDNSDIECLNDYIIKVFEYL
jgi:hypothetical protein